MVSTWTEYWKDLNKSPTEKLIYKFKRRWGYKALLDCVDVGTPGTSLEIAAGKAGISHELKKRGWHTTGLDLLPFETELDNYVIGNIFNLPFEDKSFDLVLCSGLFEHFTKEQVKMIISEMRRVGKHIACWWPVKSFIWNFFIQIRKIISGDIPLNIYSHDLPLETYSGVFSFFWIFNVRWFYL